MLSGLAFRYRGAGPDSREVLYVEAARAMNPRIGGYRDLTVGCIEIGIFGYYFEGKILDSFGLVSPEALDALDPEIAANLDQASREHPWNVFMVLKPEYVLAAPIWIPDPPPAFLEAYREVFDDGTRLQLFARRDILNPT